MFKIAKKNTITWPVTVNVPKDGGKTGKHTFNVEFEVLSTDEAQKVIKDEGDLLDRQVVGWPEGQVQNDDGSNLPFSEDAKAKLININYVRVGMYAALNEINSGRAAARKN
jgi:hypothetical protein